MKAFLVWFLSFAIIMFFSFIAFDQGYFNELWSKDSSYISFIILALFYGFTVYAGRLSVLVDRESEEIVLPRLERLWFISDACLSLGMMGTIVGFIMMLSNLYDVDISKPKMVEKFIRELGYGLSVALYTTLVGLISSVILKLQAFNIWYRLSTNEQ